jgi:sugar phosphate isomerase/epimerase
MQSSQVFAETFSFPLGLQLYSLREFLPTDFSGTLKQVGGLGYREVESAGYYKHSAAEVKQAMADARLKLVSAHYPSNDLHQQLDQIIEFNKEIGVSHIICSSPGFKDPSRLKDMKPADRNHAFTLEDWRWNAEQFNMFGERVNAAGMRFGYHNHIAEFHEVEGVVPYAELMRLTDPAKVTMEMDCGWVVVGGGDPVELLRKYPTRITMLHVKDFKAPSSATTGERTPTELGRGTIDYAPIFSEVRKAGHVKHCFVEQEGFDVPPMQSLKIDADYMHKLGVG